MGMFFTILIIVVVAVSKFALLILVYKELRKISQAEK